MPHILIVSSEPYKIPSVPLGGIFQEHQAEVLAKAGHCIGVASGGLLPLRSVMESLPPRHEQQGTIAISRNFARSLVPLRFKSETRLHQDQLDLLVTSIRSYTGKHGKPDIIHAHNLQYAALAAQVCAAELRIPYCITEHNSAFLLGTLPKSLHTQLRNAIDESAGFACVSTALARAAHELLQYHTPTLVLPNILDPELEAMARRFTPIPAKETGHQFTFLAIGRLDRNKNHALLLRAFAKAFPTSSEQLKIIGAGAESQALFQLSDELGVAQRVKFLGLKDRAGIVDALRQCNALVQTSTVETFGVSIIEALAFGNPVLTTPSGGPSDIIVNGFNGQVLPDHDTGTLANALIRLRATSDSFDRSAIQSQALDAYGAPNFVCRVNEWYASMTTPHALSR
nr:glycosyltransferase [uncultured Roseateles sp.]